MKKNSYVFFVNDIIAPPINKWIDVVEVGRRLLKKSENSVDSLIIFWYTVIITKEKRRYRPDISP